MQENPKKNKNIGQEDCSKKRCPKKSFLKTQEKFRKNLIKEYTFYLRKSFREKCIFIIRDDATKVPKVFHDFLT